MTIKPRIPHFGALAEPNVSTSKGHASLNRARILRNALIELLQEMDTFAPGFTEKFISIRADRAKAWSMIHPSHLRGDTE